MFRQQNYLVLRHLYSAKITTHYGSLQLSQIGNKTIFPDQFRVCSVLSHGPSLQLAVTMEPKSTRNDDLFDKANKIYVIYIRENSFIPKTLSNAGQKKLLCFSR